MLRQLFVERVARNPSYSLRAFARNLGVSHAYLSMIFNGHRRLPVHQAMRFSQLSGLDSDRGRALVEAARWATFDRPVRDAQSPASIRPREDYYRLQLDYFRVLSDWHYVAILDLTALANFEPDERWIAARLSLRTPVVKAAVKRLIRLGMLTIEGGRWRKTHARIEVPTYQPEEAIRRFHLQMIEKAVEAAQSSRLEDFERRDICGTTMALNPKRLAEAKRRIRRFRRSLLNYVTQGKCTELYQLNTQFFPLTVRGKGRSR